MMDSCWAKIVAAHGALAASFDADPYTILIAVPLMGLLMAVVLAPLVQRAYSRRVQRFMRLREVEPPPPAWWRRRERLLRRGDDGPGEPDMPLAQAMRQRGQRIARANLAAYLVFVLYTLLVAPHLEDMGAVDIALMVAFVAVLAAGPAVVNVRPHGSKTLMLGGAGAITALALWAEGDVGLDDALVAIAVVVLLYLTSVHRTMRALVVPLLVLSASALIGIGAALWALLPLSCLPAGAQLGGDSWVVAGGTLAGAVLAFAFCLWLGTRVLDGLARIVQRGWLSDVSLVASTGMALLAGILVGAADELQTTPGLKAALFAGWMGVTAVSYAWMLGRQPCPRSGRRLLMLRVFSPDRRAERLLDAIQSRWQLAGPVLEIGGPDLAMLNLDLNEFIRFATFRLHELFQPTAVPREMLAATLDLAPDREGRFRVNEVFCFDTSWRAVVERLLGMADAVLLDLRGFSEARKGTSHEVQRLAAMGLLPRVVALGDRDTDWSYFDRCVAEVGPGQCLALRIDGSSPEALQTCLDRLVQIADGEPASAHA